LLAYLPPSSLWPQLSQKELPSGFVDPHRLQKSPADASAALSLLGVLCVRAAPHPAQNLEPGSLADRHLGQVSIIFSL